MPLITAFSDAVREAVRPLSFRVLREVSESGDILVESLRCLKCGYNKEFNPPHQTKATGIRDCAWTHEFDWKLGKRCGGQIAFLTSKVE